MDDTSQNQSQHSQGNRRPSVTRGDEMPAGTPAPARPAANRDDSGSFVAGPGTKRAASLAAQKRWADHRMSKALASNLGLLEVTDELRPYIDMAIAKREQIVGDLVQNVGGGEIGPLTTSYVEDGALLWALSRYHATKSPTDPDTAATVKQLTVAARGHWTMARDTAAKDAAARRTGGGMPDWLVDMREGKR